MMFKTFSLWCDFIERAFLAEEFAQYMESWNLKGATSNPAIFEQALHNPSYANDIERLKKQGSSAKAIYESLATADIKKAAQILRPLYNANPQNGWVSIEIDPFLCDDVAQSVDEAKRLFRIIDEPNVMLKVPATEAGYAVIRTLFLEGISVNATLVFSPLQAVKILESLHENPKNAQAVVSVFVSRFDRACANLQQPPMLGITNAAWIHKILQTRAPSYLRTLFASTGVKGEELPHDYYIRALLFENCINTAPLAALQAFAHGEHVPNEQNDMIASCDIDTLQKRMDSFGIDVAALSAKLFAQGIVAFKDSFTNLLSRLA